MSINGDDDLAKITRNEDLRMAKVDSDEVDSSYTSLTEELFPDMRQAQVDYARALQQAHFVDYDEDGKAQPQRQTNVAEKVAELLKGTLGFDVNGQPFVYHYWWRRLTALQLKKIVLQLIVAGTRDAGGTSNPFVESVLKLLPAQPKLAIIPASKGSIVFGCGTGLNANTGETFAPTYLRAPMYGLPYPYNGDASEFPVITWFLDYSIPDEKTREVVYAYMAALVLGVDLQFVLVLKGRGGTGKGVLTRLMEALVGADNTFATSMHGLEDKHTIGNLDGKRLVVLSDVERQHHNKSFALLKSIIGGDTQTCNIKNGAIYNFVFLGLMLISCNEDGLGGRPDSGWKRRLLIIRMDRVAGEKQQKKYPNLENDMRSEIPALLRYLIKEWPEERIRDVIRKGSKSMDTERNSEIADKDGLTDFITEFAFPGGSDEHIRVGRKIVVEDKHAVYDSLNKLNTHLKFANDQEHLYPAYLTYCQFNGIVRPLSQNEFTSQFVKTANLIDGYENVKRGKNSSNQSVVYGVQLSADNPLTDQRDF